MENLFTFLIILIFIFRGLSKLMKNTAKEEQEEARPEEWKQYFEAIGIPPVKEEKEVPQMPPPLSREAEKIAVEPTPLKTEIKKREFGSEFPASIIPSLSLDKVREGIILSEILGPPKAKK